MLQLFETIKISRGETQNLSFHEERMNRSRKQLFGCADMIRLSGHIKIPGDLTEEIIRCRVIYDTGILSVEFSAYTPAATQTLAVVEAGPLDYRFKYLDRSCLTSLINKDIADDVLITRNGFITDTSYSNIVFTDGKDWFTPETPLLPGTMRAKLLQSGMIREATIRIEDLSKYTHFRLINAMLEFDAPLIPVINIVHKLPIKI